MHRERRCDFYSWRGKLELEGMKVGMKIAPEQDIFIKKLQRFLPAPAAVKSGHRSLKKIFLLIYIGNVILY